MKDFNKPAEGQVHAFVCTLSKSFMYHGSISVDTHALKPCLFTAWKHCKVSWDCTSACWPLVNEKAMGASQVALSLTTLYYQDLFYFRIKLWSRDFEWCSKHLVWCYNSKETEPLVKTSNILQMKGVHNSLGVVSWHRPTWSLTTFNLFKSRKRMTAIQHQWTNFPKLLGIILFGGSAKNKKKQKKQWITLNMIFQTKADD